MTAHEVHIVIFDGSPERAFTSKGLANDYVTAAADETDNSAHRYLVRSLEVLEAVPAPVVVWRALSERWGTPTWNAPTLLALEPTVRPDLVGESVNTSSIHVWALDADTARNRYNVIAAKYGAPLLP